MTIRPASAIDDADTIWAVLEPTIRAGETICLPTDITRAAALAYWFSEGHEVFVAESDAGIVGTYYLRANQRGGGAHIANCGYITAADAFGRGIARAMCEHSLGRARERGFRGMQFNIVVSTNVRAIRLWESCGFAVVGRVPGAFRHPTLGFADTLVMYRDL